MQSKVTLQPFDPSKKEITFRVGKENRKTFLEACFKRGFNFSLFVIILKMDIMLPSVAAAVNSDLLNSIDARELNFRIPVLNKKEGEALHLQLQEIVHGINNTSDEPSHYQGFYLNTVMEGSMLFATTALVSCAAGVALHYLNKAIRQHKPDPSYVYGAFAGGLAIMYACGNVPIIMPNLAGIATRHFCSQYLDPHLEALDNGYIKSVAGILNASLPVLASGLAALPLYSSAVYAAIATAGIVIGTHISQHIVSWGDRVAAEPSADMKLAPAL